MSFALLLALGWILTAGMARAQTDTTEEFDLCTRQPIETDTYFLHRYAQSMLEKPHNPELDRMSEDQIVNAILYYGAKKCEAVLTQHHDVFSALAILTLKGGADRELGWVAFNSYCKNDMRRECIEAEVDASQALRAINSGPGGPTTADIACTQILSDNADPVTTLKCIRGVDDHHATIKQIVTCSLKFHWHSETDGVKVGKEISDCLQSRE